MRSFRLKRYRFSSNELAAITVSDGAEYGEGTNRCLRNQAGKNKLLHILELVHISRFHSQGHL